MSKMYPGVPVDLRMKLFREEPDDEEDEDQEKEEEGEDEEEGY